jgi:hypothetical protein
VTTTQGPNVAESTLRVDLGSEDETDLQDLLRQQDLTDGLPVVIPTVERVDAFIRESGFSRETVVGAIPPSFGIATVENVATNAVMAGAKPEHLALILTSLHAMLQPEFNLAGIQVTTNPCGPLTIVSGPIRHQLGIDSGAHAVSGGNNPNGVIGRAIRFVLRNVGEAKGEVDRTTLGMPSKFSFCIAENEEASPWEPLHVSLGHSADDSVVTVTAPESIMDVCRPTFSSCEPLIWEYGELMKSVGSCRNSSAGTLLWVFPPAVARQFVAEGYTRQSLQERLFEEAKFKWGRWGNWEGLHRQQDGPQHLEDENGKVLVTRSPDDIYIMVAGRDDPIHGIYLPSVMISFASSKVVWTPS